MPVINVLLLGAHAKATESNNREDGVKESQMSEQFLLPSSIVLVAAAPTKFFAELAPIMSRELHVAAR